MTMTIVLTGFITAVFLCVRTLQTASPVSAFSNAKMRIVLDAGHGGIDSGAVSVLGDEEKHINLAVTQKLGEFFVRF